MATAPASSTSTPSIFWVFLRLGLTSFGGPVAHLGYFRTEFVDRKRWLSAEAYADLVALCQFLPGPASSQVGMAIGLRRGGLRGALAAWCGFTLPSAVVLVAFALGLAARLPDGVLHGLMLVAVAVVAQAVWQMSRTALRGPVEIVLAVAALATALLWQVALAQITIIVAAAIVGIGCFGRRSRVAAATSSVPPAPPRTARARRTAITALAGGAALLVVLPLLAWVTGSLAAEVANVFYRTGSMVFGGGHVVLPLLESEVVGRGWVGADAFVAGYGLAQAVPGPLFTFAAYLGGSMATPYLMAPIALVAIFLPGCLLVVGVLPYWDRLRANDLVRGALRGVNAAVIGILAAALYRPVFTSAVFGWPDLLIALAAFGALMLLKAPPWLVVLLTGAVSAAVAYL